MEPEGSTRADRAPQTDAGGWVEGILRAERDLSLILSRTSSLTEALDACLQTALALSGMDSGGVYLARDDGGFDLLVHRGLSSGYTDDSILRLGVLDRSLHFIGRPYSADALSRKIREVLGGRQ